MKITYIAKELDLLEGGSNFSLDLIASRLVDRGHDVEVTTIKPPKSTPPKNPPYSLNITRSSNLRYRELYKTFKLLNRLEDKTDIFHIFAPALHPAAGAYRLAGGKTPVVGRLNSYDSFCTNKDEMRTECYTNCSSLDKAKHDKAGFFKNFIKFPIYLSRTYVELSLINNIDMAFAVSPKVKSIHEEAGLKDELIKVVPNFYDKSFGDADLSLELNWPTDKLNLLYIGGLEKHKGVQILLKGISNLDKGIHLHVVGRGSYEKELKKIACDHSIEDKISFHGWVKHNKLHHYYKSADLFIQPSIWPEPMSRTLLESLQCGTPVICSKKGGSEWVIGNAGTSYKGESPKALQEVLKKANSKMIKTWQKECPKEIKRFEPERIISILEDQYNRLVH